MIGKDFKQEHGEDFYAIIPYKYKTIYTNGRDPTVYQKEICFAKFEHVFADATYVDEIAKIRLCDDSRVSVIQNNKYKTDKCLIIDNKYMQHFFGSATPAQCMEAVKQNANMLRAIGDDKQTPEMCEIALKQDPNLFECALYKPLQMCLKMIKKAPTTICKIKDPTPEMCMAAVKKNGRMIKHINNPTPELCIAAVKQNGFALEFIKNQTQEICMEAIQQDKNAVQFVNKDIILQMFEYFRFNHVHF